MTEHVYLVTGGTGGLGRATCEELGRQGETVIVNDLPDQREEAKTVAEAVERAGGEATVSLGDVSDLEYTATLVADTIGTHDRLDGIINYAGLLRDSYLTEMSGAEWEDVISVHLVGHFGLLRSAARKWQETSEERSTARAFVCVTSPAALGNVGQANYAAAKAGVLGLTRTAATELNRFGVRVNALLPIAHTAMTESFLDSEEYPPEKVAPVAAFLADAEAADMTGCTVRAAGDNVGILSNPKIEQTAFSSGGWSVEELREYRDHVFGDESDRFRTETQV